MVYRLLLLLSCSSCSFFRSQAAEKGIQIKVEQWVHSTDRWPNKQLGYMVEGEWARWMR
jgi:hypothetical protein